MLQPAHRPAWIWDVMQPLERRKREHGAVPVESSPRPARPARKIENRRTPRCRSASPDRRMAMKSTGGTVVKPMILRGSTSNNFPGQPSVRVWRSPDWVSRRTKVAAVSPRVLKRIDIQRSRIACRKTQGPCSPMPPKLLATTAAACASRPLAARGGGSGHPDPGYPRSVVTSRALPLPAL